VTNANGSDIAVMWQQLRQSATLTAVWWRLAHKYAAQGLPWQAGYAARQAVRLDASLEPKCQKLNIGQWKEADGGDGLLGRSCYRMQGYRSSDFRRVSMNVMATG